MRVSLVVLAVAVPLLLVTPAVAQPVATDFYDIPNVPSTVFVEVEGGVVIRGILLDRDGESLTVLVGEQEVRLDRTEVRRIFRKRGPSLDAIRTGGRIGLAAGLAIGLALPVEACDANHGTDRVICLGLAKGAVTFVVSVTTVGLGTLIAVAIDLVRAPKRVIYERPAGPTFALAPVIARDRKGLSLSIGW
jgi:hypothetical protein